MPLQVSERQAAYGAGAAAALPVLMSAGGVDLEGHVVNMADWIFEGDTGSASFVSGIAFTAIGLAGILGAWIGPLNGRRGMTAMGVGIGFLALGVQSFDVARRQ